MEGRKGFDDTQPELVKHAKRLARKSPKTGKARSLREIAAGDRGGLAVLSFTLLTAPFSPSQVQRLIAYGLAKALGSRPAV